MRSLRSLLIIPLLAATALTAAPAPASAALSVGISVGVAPPPLPVYEQPAIPGPGYVWTPGYWAWGGPEGYYWVPGTWIIPPTVGFYWTPPWWGWSNGAYLFNAGYWGPTVGFYGGIDYGFGYFGHGYDGGRWDHGRFFYNREANNFGNVRVANVFDRHVDSTRTVNRVSFNGGTGGISAQPTAQERTAMSSRHVGPTALQQRNVTAARSNPSFRASANNGQPAVTATSHAGRFNTAAVQGGNAAAVQHGNNAAVQRGSTSTTSVQRNATVQHGSTAATGTRPFAATGQPVGTARTDLRTSHQNTTVATPKTATVATPRTGVQTTNRFAQHQTNQTVSHAASGRFGAGRSPVVQARPSPGVTRSAPAHFSGAPAMHGPAVHAPAKVSGGGRPAPGKQDEHR